MIWGEGENNNGIDGLVKVINLFKYLYEGRTYAKAYRKL